MHPVITKTFGGLSGPYYARQFLFGLIFPGIFVLVRWGAQSHGASPQPVAFATYVMLVVNTLLYPYARFVYEGVVGFILGRNVFIVNAALLLFAKLMTIVLCWSVAVLIAPIGLLYLYLHHSRRPAA